MASAMPNLQSVSGTRGRGNCRFGGSILHCACDSPHCRPQTSEMMVRSLHCALASCSAVYCNRSCLWVCNGRAVSDCPHLTTASVRAVFASLWVLFHFFRYDEVSCWYVMYRNIAYVPAARPQLYQRPELYVTSRKHLALNQQHITLSISGSVHAVLLAYTVHWIDHWEYTDLIIFKKMLDIVGRCSSL